MSKNKRKLKLAEKYEGKKLTLFDTPEKRARLVDDPSLPPLERIKRDLSARVIFIDRKEAAALSKERKKVWRKRLPDMPKEEFQAIWKQGKAHANEVFNEHERKNRTD